MTRTDYLNQLNKYLKRLPQKDYEEAMEYFIQYFDEAGVENEEAVIKELGSPKEAASDILDAMLDEDNKPHQTPIRRLWIIILMLLAAPLALPIVLILLTGLFIGIVLLLFFVITAFAFLLAGVIAISNIIIELFTLPTTPAIWGLGLGLILCIIAFIILESFVLLGLGKLLIKGITASIRSISQKRKGHCK